MALGLMRGGMAVVGLSADAVRVIRVIRIRVILCGVPRSGTAQSFCLRSCFAAVAATLLRSASLLSVDGVEVMSERLNSCIARRVSTLNDGVSGESHQVRVECEERASRRAAEKGKARENSCRPERERGISGEASQARWNGQEKRLKRSIH